MALLGGGVVNPPHPPILIGPIRRIGPICFSTLVLAPLFYTHRSSPAVLFHLPAFLPVHHGSLDFPIGFPVTDIVSLIEAILAFPDCNLNLDFTVFPVEGEGNQRVPFDFGYFQ